EKDGLDCLGVRHADPRNFRAADRVGWGRGGASAFHVFGGAVPDRHFVPGFYQAGCHGPSHNSQAQKRYAHAHRLLNRVCPVGLSVREKPKPANWLRESQRVPFEVSRLDMTIVTTVKQSERSLP